MDFVWFKDIYYKKIAKRNTLILFMIWDFIFSQNHRNFSKKIAEHSIFLIRKCLLHIYDLKMSRKPYFLTLHLKMQTRLDFDLTSPKVRLGGLGRQNGPQIAIETWGDLPIYTINNNIL
jgi:hypothetical protein